MGIFFVSLWHLRTVARLSSFRGVDVLYPDDPRSFCFALPAAGHGAAVSSIRLPGFARPVSLARFVHRSAVAALQAAIHLAGVGYHRIGCAGLLALATIAKSKIAKERLASRLTVFGSPPEGAEFHARLP